MELLSPPAALVADALSFLASAVTLSLIKPAEPIPDERLGRGVRPGLRFIRGSRVMWSALGATATINFFNFAFFTLFILYATRSLGVAPGTLGLVLGAGAVGGLVGSLITARVSRRIGVGPAFLLGCLIFPVPLVLVPLAGGPKAVILAALFLAEFGSGLGVMLLDISIASIFAALVPEDLRARVSGAYTAVNYGVRPVGSLVAARWGR